MGASKVNKPLSVKEQDTFVRLLDRIHRQALVVPDEIIEKAKAIVAFCREHLDSDGEEWKFNLGRSSFDITTDTSKGWSDYQSYAVDVHFKLKWSRSYHSAYHNDTVCDETALIVGTMNFPFGLPNKIHQRVE